MSRPRFIGLLLALVTLLVYLPVCRYQFVVFDDNDYITENHIVQNGPTWAAVQWAFTTWHTSNWHPVTWLSHLLDCGLFGLNPGAHHFVNALLHAANAMLLFALLLRLTGALWPSAFVAALFAWHPLHVESVAWISERKDVLSTLFAFLTLLAYARYAQKRPGVKSRESGTTPAIGPQPSSSDYFLALIFFALGLMSKPMLVTLPFVMVLLDFWPLQRFPSGQRLAFEKWPFFLLTAISCVVTFLAQRGGDAGNAIVALKQVPLALRLENTLVAYALYLLKAIWPASLSVFYPLPAHLAWGQVISAAAVLVLISWCVWRARRRFPYLLVGWLWFLGTLVPVIGLVQVGGALLADRYTYIPFIGIFIAFAFGIRDLANRLQIPKILVAAAATLILTGCLALTEKQLRFWRNSETLFRHALAVTQNNDVAHVNLGVVLEQQGNLAGALAEYRAAARLVPGRYQIHNNLGNLLDNLGQTEKALAEYREAVRLNPKLPSLRDGLGSVLAELGRFSEAMTEFTNAARLDSAYPWPHFEMGKALLKQGREAEAIDQFRVALRIDPDNFQILAYTAHVLAAIENPQIRDGKTALVLAAKANALTSGAQPNVLDAFGMACAETGDFGNAQELAQKALERATAAKMKNLEERRQRLELYKRHQPWRESFLFTNAPAKN